jgi:protein-tyrosine phosphatase
MPGFALNWDEIRPDIVVGSCPFTAADLEYIRAEAKVSAMLSLQHDECHTHLNIDYAGLRAHGERLGLAMARLPIRDFDVADMRRALPAAVRELDALLRAHHKVYVHCTAGTGRSPLVVLGYLTFIEGWSAPEAGALIKARRPGVAPSWEAYFGCRSDLSESRRESIARSVRQLCGEHPSVPFEEHWAHAEMDVLREVVRGVER